MRLKLLGVAGPKRLRVEAKLSSVSIVLTFFGVVSPAYSQAHYTGFLYTNGTYSAISDPLGIHTEALGINNSGQIVGFYQSSDLVPHGFDYNKGIYPRSMFLDRGSL